MKRLFFIFTMICVFMISVCAYSVSVAENLENSLIRLHIIAQSNSDADQRIKLAVRDRVLADTADIDISDTDRFVSVATGSANTYLAQNNIPYRATAQFGKFRFPRKNYDGITLPSGIYNGVRIVLGNGNGQNWWCVMYPPLCVSEKRSESENQLKSILSPQTYDVITKKPELRLWLLELMF